MNLDLNVITDEAIASGRTHAEIARLACAGGADAIQLRDKCCGMRELCPPGREIRAITKKTGARFIVNNRLDVALACGADGVHLGQDDLRVEVARQTGTTPLRDWRLGWKRGRGGYRRRSRGRLRSRAARSFPQRPRTMPGPGLGLAALREIRAVVTIPVIAIGGVSRENVGEVIRAGADGVAVISAVVGQPDITAAARDLKDRIAAAQRERLR